MRGTSGPIWLFDLDNTLHNASAHIFPHINRCMTTYMQTHLGLTADDANTLRVRYWRQYGATLSGLMRHHGTDPRHFLAATHRFERLHQLVVFERALRAMLAHLPGRKILFSNGPRDYACAVLDAMGIHHLFDAVCGIEQMHFQPKPRIAAFRHLLHDHRLQAHRCILVEDTPENLRTAKRLGMRTVLVGRQLRVPAYVDLRVSSILALRRAAGRLRPH